MDNVIGTDKQAHEEKALENLVYEANTDHLWRFSTSDILLGIGTAVACHAHGLYQICEASQQHSQEGLNFTVGAYAVALGGTIGAIRGLRALTNTLNYEVDKQQYSYIGEFIASVITAPFPLIGGFTFGVGKGFTAALIGYATVIPAVLLHAAGK